MNAQSNLIDNPYAAHLDKISDLPWITNSSIIEDTVRLNVNGFPPNYIPTWPEHTYEKRISKLDKDTPFDLIYNPVVKSFIDLYTIRKRELSSRVLGISDLYFPIFAELKQGQRLNSLLFQ